MKKFSELGVEGLKNLFVGDKIKIVKILNCEIIVHAYKIEDSKFPKNKSGKVLTLQIEIDSEKKIIFTGSDVLLSQIQQIKDEDFPFIATIVKNNEHFEFK